MSFKAAGHDLWRDFFVRAMPLIVFLMCFLFITGLERTYRACSPDHIHFQYERSTGYWTSDLMMQALPIRALRATPLRSLWYLHKQPPVLDAIRALTAQFLKRVPENVLLKRVDSFLYLVWGLFFAGIATVVYVWLKKLTNLWFALIAVFFWMLHPAPIFYAMLLEGTNMSAFFVLWFIYELWRYGKGRGSVVSVAFAAVILFYTRTMFPWYFFLVLMTALVFLKTPARQLLVFTGIVLILAGPLLVKQSLLFGTTDTTTFSGEHKCGILWYKPEAREISGARATMVFHYPPEAKLYSGGDPLNSEEQYQTNLVWTALANAKMRSDPAGMLSAVFRSLIYDLQRYWKPSAQYTNNIVVDRLIWAPAYNAVFSGWVFIGLLLLSVWLGCSKGVVGERGILLSGRKTVGMMIVIGYIFLLSNLNNRNGWTEADRLKFILEPWFYVLILSCLYRFFEGSGNRFKRARRRWQGETMLLRPPASLQESRDLIIGDVPAREGAKDAAVYLSLVLPTYNEGSSIEGIIRQLCRELDGRIPGRYELIVVDDDSPDGTWSIAQSLVSKYPQLVVIRRRHERGLATAVIRGWQAAQGEVLGVMDADLQHSPLVLPELLEAARTADLVVASRYMAAGGLGDLNWVRRFASHAARLLALMMLPEVAGQISDPMSGYFLVRRGMISHVRLSPLGYKTLIEILARGRKGRVAEVGYVFRERQNGASKIGPRIFLDYVRHLLRLRFVGPSRSGGIR